MERPSALPAWVERNASGVAAGLALVVFLPSLAGGFLYDDVSLILDNRSIRHLSALRMILAYEPSRPLLNLTWAINYAAAGTTPWSYHLVNVAIHAANAALMATLFRFLARRGTSFLSTGAAALAAFLFAVTPMATETVAYVASRSTALATLCGLVSLRFSVSGLLERRRGMLAGGILFFLLALGTKEEAAAIPFLLLLLDYFFLSGQNLRDVRSRFTGHAVFFAILMAGLLARGVVTGAFLPAGDAIVGRGRYLLTQAAAFPGYLVRAAVPFDPALYRGRPPASWPPGSFDALLAFLTVALVVTAVMRRRAWPLYSLAVLWLAAGLLPSSSLVPLNEMVVDHRAYLGSMGVLLLLAVGLERTRSFAAVAVVLVLWAGVTIRYERVLADPLAVWQEAAARAPEAAIPQMALAQIYAETDGHRAEEALRRAIAIEPRNAQALANLGALYLERGRDTEALALIRNAAHAAPKDAKIQDNLGLALVRMGKTDEARRAFEAAIAADPLLAQPHLDLAELLLDRGDAATARTHIDTAARLEIDPEDAAEIERLQRRLP